MSAHGTFASVGSVGAALVGGTTIDTNISADLTDVRKQQSEANESPVWKRERAEEQTILKEVHNEAAAIREKQHQAARDAANRISADIDDAIRQLTSIAGSDPRAQAKVESLKGLKAIAAAAANGNTMAIAQLMSTDISGQISTASASVNTQVQADMEVGYKTPTHAYYIPHHLHYTYQAMCAPLTNEHNLQGFLHAALDDDGMPKSFNDMQTHTMEDWLHHSPDGQRVLDTIKNAPPEVTREVVAGELTAKDAIDKAAKAAKPGTEDARKLNMARDEKLGEFSPDMADERDKLAQKKITPQQYAEEEKTHVDVQHRHLVGFGDSKVGQDIAAKALPKPEQRADADSIGGTAAVLARFGVVKLNAHRLKDATQALEQLRDHPDSWGKHSPELRKDMAALLKGGALVEGQALLLHAADIQHKYLQLHPEKETAQDKANWSILTNKTPATEGQWTGALMNYATNNHADAIMQHLGQSEQKALNRSAQSIHAQAAKQTDGLGSVLATMEHKASTLADIHMHYQHAVDALDTKELNKASNKTYDGWRNNLGHGVVGTAVGATAWAVTEASGRYDMANKYVDYSIQGAEKKIADGASDLAHKGWQNAVDTWHSWTHGSTPAKPADPHHQQPQHAAQVAQQHPNNNQHPGQQANNQHPANGQHPADPKHPAIDPKHPAAVAAKDAAKNVHAQTDGKDHKQGDQHPAQVAAKKPEPQKGAVQAHA